MPSRKQRRRRQKERRHDYEFVYVDEGGQEVEVDPAELKAGRADAAKNGKPAQRRASGPVIQPPSFRRVLKRSLLISLLIFVTVMLLSSDLSRLQQVIQTLILLAFFVPFSYFMDTLMYRRYVRRTGGS